MNEEQFRQLAQERGYGDFQTKDHVPSNDSPLHTHDFSVMLLVVEGHFILAFKEGTSDYRVGDVCELDANVMHTERTGPTGARVLSARRVLCAPT